MIFRRIATFVAATMMAALVIAGAYAWMNGVRFFAVESGSMAPALNPGDLIIDLPTTSHSTYRIGEIITFHPNPGYTTTHRIVALGAEGIGTKGDANSTPDLGWLPPEKIVGRVAATLPFVGSVALFARQPGGLLALLLLMAAIAVGSEVIRRPKPAVPRVIDAPAQPEWPTHSGGDWR